jgi:ABC-type branched-subunit amino acid transport system ATPase component
VLGPVIGAVVLSWLEHSFASQAEYSQLLLGAALIFVVLFAKGGITGVLGRILRRTPDRAAGETSRRSAEYGVSSAPTLERSSALASAPCGEPVLVVADLRRRFGGVAAVDGISFDLRPGEVLGVIGPNGAGKTTMINMVSGHIIPSAGRIELGGRRLTGAPSHRMSRQGIARSYQQTSVFAGVTVRENLARAKAFSPRWIAETELAELLAATGLDERLDDQAGDLPYGLQKLLGLLLPIATQPRVLLLDEPAAGLERTERGRIDELVDWVASRGCAVLLVEHDMDLVRRICPSVIVMDTGRPLCVGTPDQVFADPEVISAYLGASEEDELVPEALGADSPNSAADEDSDRSPATVGEEDNHG